MAVAVAAVALSCSNDGAKTQDSHGTTTASPHSTTTPSGAGSATFDKTCDDLLSTTDVGGVFGQGAQLVDDPLGNPDGALLACLYETVEGSELDTSTRQLQVRVWKGTAQYEPARANPTSEPLADLGDDAFVSVAGAVTAGFRESDLSVLVDYTITLAGPDHPEAADRKDQVVDLLRQIHTNLSQP